MQKVLRKSFLVLSSMSFAISLLIVISVASAIGTILQQNQTFVAYADKFGGFWTDFFVFMGLTNLYATGWFLVVMAMLLISTSTCLTRQTPGMLKEIRSWRFNVQKASFPRYRQHVTFDAPKDLDGSVALSQRVLKTAGYETKAEQQPDAMLVSAKKGRWNRMGYIGTHLGIVVICIGGLMDSSVHVSMAERFGFVTAETRNLRLSEIEQESWLPNWNPSFRATLNLPEGVTSNAAFLPSGEGYLVQPLPFKIELIDFRTQHYPSGPPKSFDSELRIIDESASPSEFATVISVNHPLTYRGITVYQSSFEDGGSNLKIDALPIYGGEKISFEGEVKTEREWVEGSTIEFDDFRLFNINPLQVDEETIEERNFGPNFTYKIRQKDGSAREYVTYMQPVPMQGIPVILGGMRQTQREEFSYVQIPADRLGSPLGFMTLYNHLADRTLRDQVLVDAANAMRPNDSDEDQARLVASLDSLVEQVLEGGLARVAENIERSVPEAQRETMFQTLSDLAFTVFAQAYANSGVMDELPAGIDESMWLERALFAASGMQLYGATHFFQLTGFDQVQASGLQIVRAPGTGLVYLGCALLTLGVFAMFYSHQRRIWVRFEPQENGVSIMAAGSDVRRAADFETEFQTVTNVIRKQLM
ncbi:MAG: cytochrome c biogenesis protein ResB [Gammaproteobacteria bacterium]|nr:cytochrome c biogenesis protein ResB [Gammaproteobacteria bacterium]